MTKIANYTNCITKIAKKIEITKIASHFADEKVPSAKWASHLRKYKYLKHSCALGTCTFADENFFFLIFFLYK